MTAEVLDYRIKQIKHITGIDILDDKSLDEALFKLIRMYSNLKIKNMEIRAKAIDEFAEKLSLEVSESIIWDMLATMSKNSSLSDTSDEIVDYVINTANEIAERLKVGGENG